MIISILTISENKPGSKDATTPLNGFLCVNIKHLKLKKISLLCAHTKMLLWLVINDLVGRLTVA